MDYISQINLQLLLPNSFINESKNIPILKHGQWTLFLKKKKKKRGAPVAEFNFKITERLSSRLCKRRLLFSQSTSRRVLVLIRRVGELFPSRFSSARKRETFVFEPERRERKIVGRRIMDFKRVSWVFN